MENQNERRYLLYASIIVFALEAENHTFLYTSALETSVEGLVGRADNELCRERTTARMLMSSIPNVSTQG